MRKSFDSEKFAIQMHLSVTVFESNVGRREAGGVRGGSRGRRYSDNLCGQNCSLMFSQNAAVPRGGGID